MDEWPGTPVSDYDMAGYRKKYGEPNQAQGQHLTDEFKLPNHMTFSSESMYSSPEKTGGKWTQVDGKWHFAPSPYNLQQHNAQQMQDYFKTREPDAVLDMPQAQWPGMPVQSVPHDHPSHAFQDYLSTSASQLKTGAREAWEGLKETGSDIAKGYAQGTQGAQTWAAKPL